MPELTNEQKDQLLHFAEAQATEILAQDDAQIVALHVSMLLAYQKDPKRMHPLMNAAKDLYETTKVGIK